MSNDTNLKILITANDQTAEGVNSARVNVQGLSGAVHDWASDFVTDTAKAAASMFALREIIHATADTIGEIATKADELRDLTTSIGLLSSNFGEGQKSMAFFRKEQDDTRNSATELAALYRDELPLAVKHFGEEGTRDITVMLAQIAPLVGKTASDMEEGFKQLLAGRVRGTNPILIALGMTKEDFQDQGFDGLLDKLADGAERGRAMGDTFASAGHKIKEEWFDVLAEGFNSGRDAQDSFVEDMKRELLAPDVLQGLRDIGSGIAGIEKAFGFATIALDNFDKNLRNAIGDAEKLKAVSAGAIAAGAVGSFFGPGGLILGAAAGGIVAGVTNAYADPSLSDEENATAKSQEQQIQALRNQRVGRNALAGLDIEHIEGGPYNSLAALETSFGAFASSHTPDEVKRALAAVNDEIHDGTLKWTDYTSSIAYVTTHLHDIHDALANTGPDLAKLNAELEEQIKKLALGLQVDQAGFAANKQFVGLTVTSPFERKQDDAEIDHNQKLAELYERQAVAQATIDKLSGVQDDGAKKRVADAETEIAAISHLRDIENSRFEMVKNLSNVDFWHKFDEENAQALADALRKVDEFAAATEGKLASMAPAAQTAIREGLARIKSEVQDAMVAIQMTQVNLAMMGFMPDDPQIVAMTKGLRLDTDQNAKVDEANVIRIGDRLNADAEKSAAKIAAQFDIAFHGAESMFNDLFQNGGRDFGRTAAQMFAASAGDLFSRNLESLLEKSAGVFQGSDGLYYSPGTGTQGFKTPQSVVQASPTGLNFAIGAAAVGDIFSGYQAGASGQPDAVLSSTVNGAVEGAMLGFAKGATSGSIYGAVIGAALGFAAAELGKSETNPNVGGIPQVDFAGHGTVLATPGSGFDQAQIDTWSRNITSTFDTMRDAITKAFIAGGGTPPGMATFANLSPLTAPNKNLAASDIDQWINGGMGAQMMVKVGKDFTVLAENLGMSSQRFGEIWDDLSRIDPKQGAQDVESLFTFLSGLRDFKTFMAGDRSVATLLGTSGSTTYQTETGKLAQAGPYDDLIDFGSQMVTFASQIKDYSPEGQIAQMGQLTTMMTQYRDLEKQKIQELYQTVLTEHAKYEQATYGIDVARYTKADGSVDEYGLSQFYQKRANVDLTEIGNAKNAQELAQFNEDYIQQIINAANAGIAQDPSKRQDWLTWEQKQLDIGQGAFDKRADALGISIDKINTSVTSELDPAFTQLLGTTNLLNTGVGNAGNTVVGLIPPLEGMKGRVLDVNTNLTAMSAAVHDVTVDFNAFKNSVAVPPSSGSTGAAAVRSQGAAVAGGMYSSVATAAQIAALIQEVQGLRAQVAQITANTGATAENTATTAENTAATAQHAGNTTAGVESLANSVRTNGFVGRTQVARGR